MQRISAADLPLDNGQILDCPILRTKTAVIHDQRHRPQELEQKGTSKVGIKSLREEGAWCLTLCAVWPQDQRSDTVFPYSAQVK